MLERKYIRKENVVLRHIAGDTLLVPIRGKLADMQELHVLEGEGEFIWDMLDGQTSLSRIRASMVDTFDVSDSQAEKDLSEFITASLEAGLICEGAAA